jgi:hypothetical protein
MARLKRGNAALGKPPYNRNAAKKPNNPLPVEAAKKALGRPPVYKPEYDELVERLALLTMTDEEMASVIGVNVSTFKKWDVAHPSFRSARVAGRIEADAEVAQALKHRAKGYSHPAVKIFMPAGATSPVVVNYTEHYPPDTNAAALWLSNRQGGKWKLKPGEEKSTDVGITIKVEGGLPDEE